MSQPMGSAGSDVGRGGVRRTTVAGLVLALLLTGGSAPGTPGVGADTTYDGTGYHNSGMPQENPALFAQHTYTLTFTKPGTYDYVCVVHGPGMGGTVEVKDRVSGAPTSAAAQGAREQAALLRAGTAALAGWKPTSQGSTVVAPMVGSIALGYARSEGRR